MELGTPFYGVGIWTKGFIWFKNKKIEEKCDLDEFQAHRFLEGIGEVLSVKELRAKLKKLDIDSNNRLSISEYIVGKYKLSPKKYTESEQGGVDPDEMAAAQKKCEDAQESLNLAISSAEIAKGNKNKATLATKEATKSHELAIEAANKAKIALDESNKKAAEAAESLEKSNIAAEEAKVATKNQEKEEANLRKIEDEVKSAVATLESEEKAYHDKISKLESKVNDKNLSTVKKGSFVAQLAQVKSEDPMPLRKAKITQSAALKKQKKERKKAAKVTEICRTKQKDAETAANTSQKAKVEADEAAEVAAQAKTLADTAETSAETDKKNAEDAQRVAEESEEKANNAVDEAQKLFVEANECLNKLKNSDKPPKGAIWWMQRTMTEQEKFMPKRKKKKNN